MILSHVKFLFAKEKNGLERVLVASLLIKNKISLNNKLKLNNLIILREKNLDFFLKLLENNDLKEQYEKNSYLNSQLKIKAIEKTFLKSFTLPRITPEEWFELMSTWINTQNEFSHQFSQQIILKSKTYKNDIINEMIILLFLSFLFLICFLFLLSYIYKDINKELDDIISSISFLSKNDLNKYNKIPINSNNELSKIASKFNELVIELKERESNTNKITKDLQKSKDDLEKSSKLKSEFLANMSHEIRTPLNAIVGFISILKEEEKDVKKREYFNIINSSSENLLEMINDILDFSKIEKNKVILDAKEINLLEELHNITDLFTFKLKEKEIVLDLNFAKDLPREILIDCLKLKQILTNLIGNAIKFAQNNTQIFFTVKIVKNKLYFSVRDEGIGIPLDKQNSIFEPFLQADNSTTRKYGGTGLGLTISKRLVETFGGNLELKSQSGKGSEFYFSIPFIESDNPIVSKEVKSDSTQYLKGKVLLVEDNKANQMFMKVILKKMNLTFDIANDGLEAIRKFTDNDYDLILMDENMPNMSGIEATKVILDLEEKNNLKHTPIIALTANALTGDRARFLNAGMDEYLTKPVNKKELFSLLNLFLVINNR